jgi:hypothetical protein
MLVKILLVILGIIVFILSRTLFSVLIVALLPVVVVLMVSNMLNKSIVGIICAFNLAGIAPFVPTIIHAVGGLDSIGRDLFVNPSFWASSYGGVGFGVAMVCLIPNLVTYAIISAVKVQKTIIQRQQARLVEEWGNEVAE